MGIICTLFLGAKLYPADYPGCRPLFNALEFSCRFYNLERLNYSQNNDDEQE